MRHAARQLPSWLPFGAGKKMSNPKFNREKARRLDVVRIRGGEPVTSEDWEPGGTPIAHDLRIRRNESELLAALKAETRKLQVLCWERKLSPTQASRLAAQVAVLKSTKADISGKKLFVGSPEMLEARTWLDLALLFIELLESGQTLSTMRVNIDRVAALIGRHEYFRKCVVPDEEIEFLRHYFPLYLQLRPLKNDFGSPGLVLRYLRWRFPGEKF